MFLKAFQRLHTALFPQVSYYRALFSQVSLWNVRLGLVRLCWANFERSEKLPSLTQHRIVPWEKISVTSQLWQDLVTLIVLYVFIADSREKMEKKLRRRLAWGLLLSLSVLILHGLIELFFVPKNEDSNLSKNYSTIICKKKTSFQNRNNNH